MGLPFASTWQAAETSEQRSAIERRAKPQAPAHRARYPTFGELNSTRVAPPVGSNPSPPEAGRAHAPKRATPGNQPVLSGVEQPSRHSDQEICQGFMLMVESARSLLCGPQRPIGGHGSEECHDMRGAPHPDCGRTWSLVGKI